MDQSEVEAFNYNFSVFNGKELKGQRNSPAKYELEGSESNLKSMEEEEEVVEPTKTAEEKKKMRESLDKLLEAFEGTDLDNSPPPDDFLRKSFEFMYGKQYGDNTEQKKDKKEQLEVSTGVIPAVMFEQITEMI